MRQHSMCTQLDNDKEQGRPVANNRTAAVSRMAVRHKKLQQLDKDASEAQKIHIGPVWHALGMQLLHFQPRKHSSRSRSFDNPTAALRASHPWPQNHSPASSKCRPSVTAQRRGIHWQSTCCHLPGRATAAGLQAPAIHIVYPSARLVPSGPPRLPLLPLSLRAAA
jgi:hypothetical protein